MFNLVLVGLTGAFCISLAGASKLPIILEEGDAIPTIDFDTVQSLALVWASAKDFPEFPKLIEQSRRNSVEFIIKQMRKGQRTYANQYRQAAGVLLSKGDNYYPQYDYKLKVKDVLQFMDAVDEGIKKEIRARRIDVDCLNSN